MDRKICIKNFVQNILGCACPDKVFEQIEDRRFAPSVSPHTRSIIVGGKLLVYIWIVQEEQELHEKLHAMLEAGKKERDERKLNRFRAVLAADTPQSLAFRAQSYFSKYENRDDRMLLHVISSSDLKNL